MWLQNGLFLFFVLIIFTGMSNRPCWPILRTIFLNSSVTLALLGAYKVKYNKYTERNILVDHCLYIYFSYSTYHIHIVHLTCTTCMNMSIILILFYYVFWWIKYLSCITAFLFMADRSSFQKLLAVWFLAKLYQCILQRKECWIIQLIPSVIWVPLTKFIVIAKYANKSKSIRSRESLSQIACDLILSTLWKDGLPTSLILANKSLH